MTKIGLNGMEIPIHMKRKHKNDITSTQTPMLETARCTCWEKDRKGKPLKAEYKRWKTEVMSDGHGHCKHCQLKMKRFWPLKEKAVES